MLLYSNASGNSGMTAYVTMLKWLIVIVKIKLVNKNSEQILGWTGGQNVLFNLHIYSIVQLSVVLVLRIVLLLQGGYIITAVTL